MMMMMVLFLIVGVFVSCSLAEDSRIKAEGSPVGSRLPKQADFEEWPHYQTNIYDSERIFGLNQRGLRSRCKTNQDCYKDECCVFWRKNGHKVCRKLLLSGSKCHPFIKPGLSESCPCAPGLTCALLKSFNLHKYRGIFKCETIPSNQGDKEYEDI